MLPCPHQRLVDITPARKFRVLLHTNPKRERGECLGTRAGASEDFIGPSLALRVGM